MAFVDRGLTFSCLFVRKEKVLLKLVLDTKIGFLYAEGSISCT